MEISFDTSVTRSVSNPLSHLSSPLRAFPSGKRNPFAWRDLMPAARKVVTRAPHRRVGLIACPWFQPNTIEYESLLERDFVRLALLDPDVSSISHQPFS